MVRGFVAEEALADRVIELPPDSRTRASWQHTANYAEAVASEDTPVAIVDPDSGRMLSANAAALVLLRATSGIGPNEQILDFIHPSDRATFLALLDRVARIEGRLPVETVHVHRADGSQLQGIVIASGRSRQGNTPRPPVVLVGSANARVAQGGVARGPVRLGLVTDEGGFVRLVDRLVEGWGYGAADVLGLSGFLLAHPADVASFVLAAGGLANVDTAQAALSIRALHADGSWRPYVAVLRALMGREGERGFSLTFVEPDDQAPVLESDPRLAALTRREREVLVRLLGGRRVRTIANELYLSESTVRGHLSAAFRKLGVASQVELTERFREGGDQQV